VAALSLAGVGDVVWDVEVLNGANPAEVVWSKRLTSSRYGDGAGSATVVGPCDASADARANTVRLWVVGVYDAPVVSAGAFARGDATGAGAVDGEALPFQSPTLAGPLTREFACLPNADVTVSFEVALMRPAVQGFFDVAVAFDDLFCSAKLDCCEAPAGPACALDGSEDLALLFDDAGARASTLVLGFACTAGPHAEVDTQLYLDALTLDCTSPSAESFGADLVLDPSGAPGNQCTAGALSACTDVVTEHGLPPVDADLYLFQVAVYRGFEALESGGEVAQKVYWNVALGVRRPAIGQCWLRTRATADGAAGTPAIDQGAVAPGVVYPYIAWDVPLGSCGAEALRFDDPTAPVRPAYTTTSGPGLGFAYGFGKHMPAGSFCVPRCENGGQCVGGRCDCPDAFTGPTCGEAAPGCGSSSDPCPDGYVCTLAGACVPAGTTPNTTPVAFVPSTLALPVGATATLAASDGDAPYRYALVSGGGTLEGATYTAPGAPGSARVQVTDAFGGTAALDITVYAPLSLDPSHVSLLAGESQTFSASGGVGAYTFALALGDGALTGATYTAGATLGIATVRVTDALGNTADATVEVVPPLSLSPRLTLAATEQTLTLAATGGAGGYTYALVRGDGTLADAALTTASTPGEVVVRVTDAAGATAEATIVVERYPKVTTGGDAETLSHTCAVRADGTLWCWGDNTWGQLGDGTTTRSYGPVQVGTASDWVDVGGGHEHTCGVRADGTLWCWGRNNASQLGDGTTSDHLAPVQVGVGAEWATVVAGLRYGCALRRDGSLWCWGTGVYGSLGQGDTIAETTPARVGADSAWRALTSGAKHVCALKTDDSLWCWGYNGKGATGGGGTIVTLPYNVLPSVAWSTVSGGDDHTCAIRVDGSLWCWGSNATGQLGDGTVLTRTSPFREASAASDWTRVDAGQTGTCGLRGDGALWCWGANAFGLLQDRTLTDSLVPVAATDPTGWAALAVGTDHGCGTRDDGTLSCWGAHHSGQLGSWGAPTKTSPWPLPGTWAEAEPSPIDLSHACGRTAAGALACWGRNDFGQLGDGDVTAVFGSPAVAVAGGPAAFTRLAGAGEHTCALGSGATLWCWGRNQNGQLGDGTLDDRPTPDVVAGAWVQVRAGGDSVMGVRADGTLWGWGANGSDQLGLGSAAATRITTPTQVGADADWAAVDVMSMHGCGLRTDATLWCWGYNMTAVFGDGTQTSSDVPVAAGTGHTWASFALGYAHTCAIDPAGALWCWGDNAFGQLGLGAAVTSSKSAQQVGGDSDWTAVAAGTQATCGLRAGTIWCWGRNLMGEVGNGTQIQADTPVQVGGDTDWVDVRGGAAGMCGRHADGTVACWGNDTGGYLTGHGQIRPFASDVTWP